MKKVFLIFQLFFLGVLIAFPAILLGIKNLYQSENEYFIDTTGLVMIAAHTLLAFGTFLHHFKKLRLVSFELRASREKTLDEDFVRDTKTKSKTPSALVAANAVYGILASFLYVRLTLQLPFEGEMVSVLPQYILFASLGYVAVYFILSSIWRIT